MTISTRETTGRHEPGSPVLGGILDDIAEDPVLVDVLDDVEEDIDLTDDGTDENVTGVDQSCFDTIGSEISHITIADGSLDSSSILKTPQKGAPEHLNIDDSIGLNSFFLAILMIVISRLNSSFRERRFFI